MTKKETGCFPGRFRKMLVNFPKFVRHWQLLIHDILQNPFLRFFNILATFVSPICFHRTDLNISVFTKWGFCTTINDPLFKTYTYEPFFDAAIGFGTFRSPIPLQGSFLVLLAWGLFLVGAFEKKCRTLTAGSFFKHVRSTFLFICSTTTTWTTDVQNILKTSEPNPEQTNRRPELRKHTKDPPLPWCFHLGIFRHNATLFRKFFWLHYRVPFQFGNRMNVEQTHRVTSIIFWHFDCSNSQFLFFFPKFFWCLQRFPSSFFPYFPISWSFKKPKGAPFTISKTLRFLSLKNSAEIGRSQLVVFNPCSRPRLTWICELVCFWNVLSIALKNSVSQLFQLSITIFTL